MVPQRGAAKADEGADAALRLPRRPRHGHLARPDPALRRPGHHLLAGLAQLVGGPVLPRLRRPVRLDVRFPLARVRAWHGVQDPLDRRGAVPARLVHDHAGPDHLAVEPHQAPHRHAGRRAGPRDRRHGRERARPPAEHPHGEDVRGQQVPVLEYELPRRAPHVPDGPVLPAAGTARGDQARLRAGLPVAVGGVQGDHPGGAAPATGPGGLRAPRTAARRRPVQRADAPERRPGAAAARRDRSLRRPPMPQWIAACAADDIDPEDVIPFEHDGIDYAIYRSPDDVYYATDGHCTHEKTLLCDGLVMGGVIECPKHNGRFDYTSGKALGAPVLVDVRTYPAKVIDGTVYIEVG